MDAAKDSIDVTLYYANHTRYYDYLFGDHLRSSEKLLSRLLPFFRANKVVTVLDCCCGSGHDAEFFLKNGFSIDVSDLCDEMVSYTKQKVTRFNTEKMHFFQSDVLELETKCQDVYDLVIFRGNTIGHLSQTEQLKALVQLFKRTKPGKFILLDFREGYTYFTERKSFELRGNGHSKKDHLLYFSFYKVRHGSRFTTPYLVFSKVFTFDYRKWAVNRKLLNIKGHYVDEASIIHLLNGLNCQYEYIESDGKGLPYLKTLLIRKED
jgi:SAM-dependent methyltransferase